MPDPICRHCGEPLKAHVETDKRLLLCPRSVFSALEVTAPPIPTPSTPLTRMYDYDFSPEAMQQRYLDLQNAQQRFYNEQNSKLMERIALSTRND